MSHTQTRLPDELSNDTSWMSHYEAMQVNFGYWLRKGFLSLGDIEGANVLDFGGAAGQLAVILLQHGARQATVIDTSLPAVLYDTKLRSLENLRYSATTVEDYSEQARRVHPSGDGSPAASGEFDLVVSHTVTEHLQHPASAFAAIRQLLKPGGLFFVVHDNYYHPSGAHDNAMLTTNALGVYEYPGPKCWDSEDLCECSRSFRMSMQTRMPWAWSADAERMLTPADCEVCLFYRRTTPWAHITYQSEFTQVFPQTCFTTGQKDSMLNKITPFQLRQLLIEAGFDCELWERTFVNNVPPKELMAAPYYCNEFDLRTLNIYARCRTH